MAVPKRSVQYEPDDEPDDQPLPGSPRQGDHQVESGAGTGQRGEPDEGSLEGAGEFRLPKPEHQNADRDDDKGKQGADRDQAARLSNGEPSGRNRNGEAGDDRGDPGSLEPGMDLVAPIREQPVSRHAVEDARLT